MNKLFLILLILQTRYKQILNRPTYYQVEAIIFLNLSDIDRKQKIECGLICYSSVLFILIKVELLDLLWMK